QAVDSAFNHVSFLKVDGRLCPKRDPGRRASRDHVSGLKSHKLADVAHQAVDRKDHLAGGAVLAHPAVHRKSQAQLLRIGYLVASHEPRPDVTEAVSALAFHPLPGSLKLPAALAEVIYHAVAGDAVKCVIHRDVPDRGSDDD